MDSRPHQDDPPEGRHRDAVFEPAALTTDRPRLGRWVALIVVALVVVVAKPWDWGAAAVPRGSSGSVPASADPTIAPQPTTSPRPAATPSVDDQVAALCLDRARWLMTTVETWRDQTIRVWRALDPADAATGPTDPSIPVTPGVSDGILELGWCAPTVGDDRPGGAVSVEAWRLSDSGPKVLSMVRSRPNGGESSFGALYLAPRGGLRPPRASAPWPEGTYVFHLAIGDGRDRWFSIEIVRRGPVVRS